MFIEKARQLERAHALAGIIIDHDTSIKSSNGAIFSMTGDGFNNVHIPVVLMFKDEAFQLLHFLSKNPNLIVYIGDEKYFHQSFYQQHEFLESLIQPWNQTCQKQVYGKNYFRKFSSIISKKLKEFEISINRDLLPKQSIIEFEHIIQSNENKSVDEITSELFASLNLTAINFGGQLNNIEAYRSALDKMVRNALQSTNQTDTKESIETKDNN